MSNGHTSANSELQRISKIAADLTRTLRAQHDLVSQRGIDLPVDAINSLDAATHELNSVMERMTDERVEVQQLRALARTTELINSTLDLDLVLNDVIDTVVGLTGAERGYIILKDAETGELQFRVARNAQQRSLSDHEVLVSHSVINEVAQTGQLLVATDAADDPRLKRQESVINMVLRSILCVPLSRKGTLTGMIYADNRVQPGLFGVREQALVQAFANQAAVAIENARLFESVRASLAEITAFKNLMDNVFTSIASGVITTDSNDIVTTFNAAASRILGVPAQDSVGKSLWSVLPPLYVGFDKLLRKVQAQKVEEVVEAEPILEGRGQVSLNLKLSPLKGDDPNVIQGVAIVLNDVTELKQRNAQISTIRSYLPPAMVDNIQLIDRSQLGGEERDISIISCDVRGFTTFSESLQPEEVMEVINKFLTVSSDAIHLSEGIIDKYMGDAAVGLYNTQLNPHTDHALRAVRAAMTMVRDVEAMHDTLPPSHRLRYGIGIHTGTAVLGNVGSPSRKEFTAIGDSLQFAKLLQENAHGGEVLVSQQTYDLVKDYFEAERLTPRKLKDRFDFDCMYAITGLRRASA